MITALFTERMDGDEDFVIAVDNEKMKLMMDEEVDDEDISTWLEDQFASCDGYILKIRQFEDISRIPDVLITEYIKGDYIK